MEACMEGYIPACEEDALVCVVTPAKRFESTNLNEASFQVREIHRAEQMTADACETPYPLEEPASKFPEFLVSAEHPVEMIGGLKFLHGVNGEAAMGHWSGDDLYRRLHKGRCFELIIRETGVNAAVTDPPMDTLTPAQQKRLDQSMSLILHSFRF